MTKIARIVAIGVLAASLNEIVRRHEVLRTTAAVEGRPYQVISPSLHLPLALVDLCALPPPERDAALERVAKAVAPHPFDLAWARCRALSCRRASLRRTAC